MLLCGSCCLLIWMMSVLGYAPPLQNELMISINTDRTIETICIPIQMVRSKYMCEMLCCVVCAVDFDVILFVQCNQSIVLSTKTKSSRKNQCIYGSGVFGVFRILMDVLMMTESATDKLRICYFIFRFELNWLLLLLLLLCISFKSRTNSCWAFYHQIECMRVVSCVWYVVCHSETPIL